MGPCWECPAEGGSKRREAMGNKGKEPRAKSTQETQGNTNYLQKTRAWNKTWGQVGRKGAPGAVTAHAEVSEPCFKVPGWGTGSSGMGDHWSLRKSR